MLALIKEELNHIKMQMCVIFVEKKSYRSSLKIKIIEKLETIAMLQVNTEVQHIVYEIYDLMCPMKSL